MNPNPPIRSALIVLIAAALAAWAAGCAHVADVRQVDPGFTAEALRAGGLANLGVVQVNEIPQVRPPLIAALERVLAATRSDIPLVAAARAQATFDESTSRLLLLGYQMHGAPEAVWLARAADSLHGAARYGVLARVESAAIRYSVRDAPPDLHSPSGRIMVTGRDTRVTVSVYDLPTRVLVFTGTYAAAAESAAADTVPVKTWLQGPREQAGITVAPQEPPSQQGYPGPPPLAQALESAFVEFARSLPGGPPPQ